MSLAARQLSEQRWGAQRPVRLASEVANRAAELPPGVLDSLIRELVKERKRRNVSQERPPNIY